MTKTWTTLASAQPQCRCAYFFYSLLRIITDGSESESTYPWPKLCTNINYIAPCAPHYAAAPELLLTAAAVHLCAPVSLLYDLSITTNHRLHIAVGQHYKKSRQITTMKIYRYAFSQYWFPFSREIHPFDWFYIWPIHVSTYLSGSLLVGYKRWLKLDFMLNC